MSEVNGSFLTSMTALAGSIRNKSGVTGGLTIDQMTTAVDSIAPGGSGNLGLADVIQYDPSYTEITSFTISGLTNEETYSELDVEKYNGTWTVIDATKTKKQRVYKHATLDVYMSFFEYDEGEEEYRYSNYYGWAISNVQSITDPSTEVIIELNSHETIPSGSATFYDGMWEGYQFSSTITYNQSTIIPASITYRLVTNYDTTADGYTIPSTNYTTQYYQNEPTLNTIYAYTGSSTKTLIGKEIGSAYGNHCVFYWSGHTAPVWSNPYSGYVAETEFGGWLAQSEPSLRPVMTVLNNIQALRIPESKNLYLNSENSSLPGKFKHIKKTGSYTISVAFWVDNSTLTKPTVLGCLGYLNSGDRCLCLMLNRATGVVSGYTDGSSDYIAMTFDSTTAGWHWAAISYDGTTNAIKLRVDNVIKSTTKVLSIEYSSSTAEGYYHNFFTGSNDSKYGVSYQCEIKIWDTVLTDDQLTTEYQRVSALFV